MKKETITNRSSRTRTTSSFRATSAKTTENKFDVFEFRDEVGRENQIFFDLTTTTTTKRQSVVGRQKPKRRMKDDEDDDEEEEDFEDDNDDDDQDEDEDFLITSNESNTATDDSRSTIEKLNHQRYSNNTRIDTNHIYDEIVNNKEIMPPTTTTTSNNDSSQCLFDHNAKTNQLDRIFNFNIE